MTPIRPDAAGVADRTAPPARADHDMARRQGDARHARQTRRPTGAARSVTVDSRVFIVYAVRALEDASRVMELKFWWRTEQTDFKLPSIGEHAQQSMIDTSTLFDQRRQPYLEDSMARISVPVSNERIATDLAVDIPSARSRRC